MTREQLFEAIGGVAEDRLEQTELRSLTEDCLEQTELRSVTEDRLEQTEQGSLTSDTKESEVNRRSEKMILQADAPESSASTVTDHRNTPKKKRWNWVKYSGLAAAACIIIIIAVAIPTIRRSKYENSTASFSSGGAAYDSAASDQGMENAGLQTNGMETNGNATNGAVSQSDREESADETNGMAEGAQDSDGLDAGSPNASGGSIDYTGGADEDSANRAGEGIASPNNHSETEAVTQDASKQNSSSQDEYTADDQNKALTKGVYIEGSRIPMDVIYYPAEASTREALLLPVDDKLSEEDLGEYLGKTTGSSDKNQNGYNVYLTAAYPENEQICIIKDETGYRLYQSEQLSLPKD